MAFVVSVSKEGSVGGCFCLFFLCKHKTAYEMRISDWSSDVCSADLEAPTACARRVARNARLRRRTARVANKPHKTWRFLRHVCFRPAVARVVDAVRESSAGAWRAVGEPSPADRKSVV